MTFLYKQVLMMCLRSFLVGGAICVLGQILIDLTNITPARILVSFVVLGIFLSATGLWQKIADFRGAGALVPIIGFGHTLAKGMEEAVKIQGLVGIFTGGFMACAGGVGASLIFALIAAVLAKPNSQS